MAIFYHKYDLPSEVKLQGPTIAIDTEAMGLNNMRDRLCTVQICDGGSDVHIVHFPQPNFEAKKLREVISNEELVKVFHFARFDVAILQHSFNLDMKNIFCTKIASRLVRTYTDSHSLKSLCDELLKIKLSKQETCSDWGAENLTQDQLNYAANDVLHLHRLMEILKMRLKRENRLVIAQECFNFLPIRAKLDIIGWPEQDIFAY